MRHLWTPILGKVFSFVKWFVLLAVSHQGYWVVSSLACLQFQWNLSFLKDRGINVGFKATWCWKNSYSGAGGGGHGLLSRLFTDLSSSFQVSLLLKFAILWQQLGPLSPNLNRWKITYIHLDGKDKVSWWTEPVVIGNSEQPVSLAVGDNVNGSAWDDSDRIWWTHPVHPAAKLSLEIRFCKVYYTMSFLPLGQSVSSLLGLVWFSSLAHGFKCSRAQINSLWAIL